MKRLVGPFNEKNLTVVSREAWYRRPDELIDKVRKAWRKRKRESGARLWDGSVYRLSNILYDKDIVTLTLGKVKYKDHLTCADIRDEIVKLPFEKRPNGMFVSVYVATSDHKLIFAIKSSTSISGNSVNLIGGNMSPDETKIKSTADIYNSFLLELKEETGVAKDKIKVIFGLGIYLTDNLRIGVFLGAELKCTSKEFLDMAQPNFEHKNFIVIERDEVKKMIFSQCQELNPYICGTFEDYLALSLA